MKKRSRSSLLIIAMLVSLLIGAGYYYLILPKQQQEEAILQRIQQTQAEIAALEENINVLQEQDRYVAENMYVLRQKLPFDRMMKELLLAIEEIEYISNSKVLAVNFNNYDAPVNASVLEPPVEEAATEEAPATEQSVEDQDEEVPIDVTTSVPVSTISREALPEELKMVTFQMNVEAPDRRNIELFVQELENLARVMRIDSVSYNLMGERDLLEEQLYDLTSAVVQVTTFFYEEP